MEDELTREFVSETLFHFWKHEDADRAFGIFKSIVERGLLLSCAHGEGIDRYIVDAGDDQCRWRDVYQDARVCFTDIPEGKLETHHKKFGKCGVGFNRKTILHWGGIPVWYLPNFISDDYSLDRRGASMIRAMQNAQILAKHVRKHFDEWKSGKASELKNFFGTLEIEGERRNIDDFSSLIESADYFVGQALSYTKSISSNRRNENRNLYEREWRIVGGVVYDQHPIYRALTDDETIEFTQQNPAWSKPLTEHPDPNSPWSQNPLIHFFRLFNGIPGEATVAKKIEVIFVPNEPMQTRFYAYINQNQGLFDEKLPEVKIV